MRILNTKLVQRAYDGRWEKIALVSEDKDYYRYKDERGSMVTLTSPYWITVAVYDFIMEEV
jgi:hypothetical protein